MAALALPVLRGIKPSLVNKEDRPKFDNEIYAAIVIVIAFTTLLSPIWIKHFYRFFGHQFVIDNPNEIKP